MSSFLKSSLLQSLRPIAPPREMDHGTVVTVVAQEIGDEFAEMLAEPVPRPDGTAIDWYSVAAGDFVPVSTLAPDAQAQHRSRIDSHIERLQGRISVLEAADDASSRSRAMALRIAASFPGSDHIFVERAAASGAEPKLALVDWGFKAASDTDHGGGPLIGIAAARRPARPAPSPQAANPAAAGSSVIDRRVQQPVAHTTAVQSVGLGTGLHWLVPFLLSLLTLLLILAIFWLLLTACAVRLPLGNVYFGLGGTQACLAGARQPVDGDPGDLGILQSRLMQLEEEFARRQETCASLAQIDPPQDNSVVQDERFEQRLSHENRGDIQLTLVWNTTDDLDLFVDCPSGRTIFYNNRSDCGGQLDIDANRSDSDLTEQPVENIVWQNSIPPAGQYVVRVTLAKKRSNAGTDIPFSVRLKIGAREQVFELNHPAGARSVTVYQFNFPS